MGRRIVSVYRLAALLVDHSVFFGWAIVSFQWLAPNGREVCNFVREEVHSTGVKIFLGACAAQSI